MARKYRTIRDRLWAAQQDPIDRQNEADWEKRKAEDREREAREPAWSVVPEGREWFWCVWKKREDALPWKWGFESSEGAAASEARKVAGYPSTYVYRSGAAQALGYVKRVLREGKPR